MRHTSPDYLFSNQEWHHYSANILHSVREEASKMAPERVLQTPHEDLVEHLCQRHSLDCPRLTGEVSMDQSEVQIDVSHRVPRMWSEGGPTYVPGTELKMILPFVGASNLFSIQPSTFSTSPPIAKVTKDGLIVTYLADQLEPERIRAYFDESRNNIERHLGWLAADIAKCEAAIRQEASHQLTARRERVLKDRNAIEAIGIPLRRRGDAPATYTAPILRKPIKPELPPVPKETFKPEPVLATEQYEAIIEALSNMAHVLEKSPSAFETLGEEGIRFHFLVPLNGMFVGQASGETFNYGGKTDILMQVDGKNIFMAECKFWKGPKSLSKTFDQLLSYSSWRDTKAAVILFNRGRKLSSVLEAIPGIVEQHDCYKRAQAVSGETRFRYIMKNPHDPLREILVTLLVFDVPGPEE